MEENDGEGTKMIHRKFVCTPEDIGQFLERVDRLYAVYQYPNRYDFMSSRLNSYINRLKAYGMELDTPSILAIDCFHCTKDPIDCHYALHQVIFQMWYAHKQGEIDLGRWFEFYDKNIRDCIVDESLYD